MSPIIGEAKATLSRRVLNQSCSPGAASGAKSVIALFIRRDDVQI